jgi:hypothetical protein
MTQEQIIEFKNELQNSRFEPRTEEDCTTFAKEIIDEEVYVGFLFYPDNTIKVFATSGQTGTTYQSDFDFDEEDSIRVNIVENFTRLLAPMLYDMLFDSKAGESLKAMSGND